MAGAINAEVGIADRLQAKPSSIFPSNNPQFQRFASRRSVVHSTKGIVACSQPLAAQCGIRILQQGGNAADAAVAVAAALNVTEPSSTGIGGDVFCLFYDAKTKKTAALNGSGRSGSRITLEYMKNVREKLGGTIPVENANNVTIPGCAAGWVDTIERFGSGKLSLEQVLQPAIELAEDGFPVSEVSSSLWQFAEERLRKASPNSAEMLKPDPEAKDGVRAPWPGEIKHSPELAHTFRLLAKHGKKGFYEGEVAEALVKVVQDLGGQLTLDDLKNHANLGSEAVDGISIKFSGQNIAEPIELWEHPPNGQGLIALMALGLFEQLERAGKIKPFTQSQHNSPEYLHVLIEVLRLAFSDGRAFIADPATNKVPTAALTSPEYLASRIAAFSPDHKMSIVNHGTPPIKSDTVYLAVTDSTGNGMSFINSHAGGFGSGICPKGCGFTLQSRGVGFNLIDGHPNCVAPHKRPYHTIIPAMVTNAKDGSLNTVFGVMGMFMQPQGHLQVLLNMLVFGMNPQEALDAPRVSIEPAGPDGRATEAGQVFLEEGIGDEVVTALEKLGHRITVMKGHDRAMFGRGQVIRRSTDGGQLVWSAGSDMRGDGGAFPL